MSSFSTITRPPSSSSSSALTTYGGVLDGDRRALFGDLQIVAAVRIALDALAEEQGDARVVDPLVVAVELSLRQNEIFPDSTV